MIQNHNTRSAVTIVYSANSILIFNKLLIIFLSLQTQFLTNLLKSK